jgi:3-phenylpropionate/trans-cinnamate dioxygenase ferredoxin subunit
MNGQAALAVTVCALDEIPSGTVRKFTVGNVDVAVVRIEDSVYALGDVCSHAHVSLSEGEVWCDELELECPKHGSTFSLTTGVPSTLPATQPVPVYDATVVEGNVVVTVPVASDLAAQDIGGNA